MVRLFSFWHDDWLPSGPLVLKYGRDIMQQIPIPKNAYLRATWSWPLQPSLVLQEIRLMCDSLSLFPAEDQVICQAYKSGIFNTSDTWQWFREKKSKVTWHILVWNQFSHPKHRFTASLAVLNRLSTLSRLRNRCINLDRSSCFFCNDEETRDHVFVSCRFSKEVWRRVLEKLLINFQKHWGLAGGVRLDHCTF